MSSAVVILKILYWFAVLNFIGASFAQGFVLEDRLKECPGGYCVRLHLCINNTIVTEEEFEIDIRSRSNRNPIEVSTNKDENTDPCEEFLMRCCPAEKDITTISPIEPIMADPLVIIPEQPRSCGRGDPAGYILSVKNNSLAQYNEFPWTAALFQIGGSFEEGSAFICGGSLIHPQVVLTAAHCVRNITQPEHLMVRLGEWDIANENEPYEHRDLAVQKIVRHEQWDTLRYHNDLAVLILEKPAELMAGVNTVCLPEPDQSFDGKRCVAVGWGKDVKKIAYADVLKKVTLPVVTNGACQRMLRQNTRLGPVFQLHSSFLCAGGEDGVDTCKGDGGSPLMCDRGDGTYVQAGIVAWGIDCGRENVPGVYVKVAEFGKWIRDSIEREGLTME